MGHPRPFIVHPALEHGAGKEGVTDQNTWTDTEEDHVPFAKTKATLSRCLLQINFLSPSFFAFIKCRMGRGCLQRQGTYRKPLSTYRWTVSCRKEVYLQRQIKEINIQIK
jgi:hypothetical protein